MDQELLSKPLRARAVRALGGCCAAGLALAALACGGSVEAPQESTAGPSPGAAVAPSANLPAPDPKFVPPPVPTAEQLAALQASVEQAPSDRAARRRLAIALFAARKRADAVQQFEQLAAAENDASAWIDLANAYGMVSRIDDAVATYQKALDLEPGNATALFNLGEIAFLRAEVEQAVDYYRKALASRPEYPRAYHQLARALEHTGDYREAYTTYAKVLDFEPSSAEELLAYDDALYRMASLDITMGAHERAESMLVALLEANPNHDSAHYAYAQLLLQLGRLDEAQRQLEAHMTIQAAIAPTTQVATGD